mmetsp:Transcript_3083/g.10089  ORF Transcript_3083/g.10089 Transcript_3083/m.10089 type:complete len:215 (-) Transcript_3083:496-1140(-)
MRAARVQRLEQFVHRLEELRAGRDGARLGAEARGTATAASARLGCRGQLKDFGQGWVCRHLAELLEVFGERVAVLLQEVVCVVGDDACVVRHLKVGPAGSLELARPNVVGHLFVERLVRTLGDQALLVQQRVHAHAACEQVDGRLVVVVLDRLPRHALGVVLFLLSLQGQVDKHLVQRLVAVVDAELFERVRLEDFKAVNVEDANGVARRLGAH